MNVIVTPDEAAYAFFHECSASPIVSELIAKKFREWNMTDYASVCTTEKCKFLIKILILPIIIIIGFN